MSSPRLGSVLEELQAQCPSCVFAQVVLEVPSGKSVSTVDLVSPNGESVGIIIVPHQLSNQPNTTLTITFVSNVPSDFSHQRLGGIIMDITLTDSENDQITQLDTPLTLCFERPANFSLSKDKNVCLSYFDEVREKWRCEDKCMANIPNRSVLCGETGHLTNFALLLSGNSGETGNPCISVSQGNTLAWISLGLVAGAILIVALSVVVIEIRTRLRAWKLNKQITRGLNIA